MGSEINLVIGRYARISTQENAKALDRINFTLEQAVIGLGGRVEDSPLWTEVMSGTKRDRPEFLKMREAVQARRIDVLVTYRIDRLARDSEFGISFGRLLEKTGVRLYDCQRSGFVDFSNPSEWESYASQSVQAEAESRKLSSRIRAGKAYGRHTAAAGSKPPWGYLRDKETARYRLDPALEAAVRDSVEIILTTGGNFTESCRSINDAWNRAWKPNSLRIWVTNPVLRGHTGYLRTGRYWAEIKYGTHLDQAILSEEEYEEIEGLIRSRKKYWGNNRGLLGHSLGGLAFCGRCGSRMSVTSSNRQDNVVRYYLSCTARTQRVSREHTCDLRRSLRLDALEGVVQDLLGGAARGIACLAASEVQTPKSPRLVEAERLLSELERLGQNRALESSKAQLRLEIQQLTAAGAFETRGSVESRELLESVFSDRQTWQNLNPNARRTVFRKLIERVTLDYSEVEIGISRAGKPKHKIDWTVSLEFKPKVGIPISNALLEYVPENMRRKADRSSDGNP
jgi:site-specific DNA recombinase